MFVTYSPIESNDTAAYVRVATNIQTLDFSDYLGERTPGYPLLILIAGFNNHIVWLIQSVLSILTSIMLFMITLSHTKNKHLSFVIGLFHSLSLNMLFMEQVILTEVLSTFLLVLSLLLYTYLTKSEQNKTNILYYIALALVVSWAALTRPLLSLLVPIYFLFLLFRVWKPEIPISKRIKYLTGYIVPPTLLVWGWCFFNYATVQYFGLTTLTGINLIQHSMPYSYLASDEFSEIKHVIHQQRKSNFEESGSCNVTIWETESRMMEVSGLSSVELSRELTAMTIDIFSNKPLFYIQSVWEAWMKFWLAADIQLEDEIEQSFLTRSILLIWIPNRALIFILKILFLNISIYRIHRLISSKTMNHITDFSFIIIMIVLSASIVQALMENGATGSNLRYSMPYEPLMMYTSIVTIWRFFCNRSGGLPT
jgi:hypothetical protein